MGNWAPHSFTRLIIIITFLHFELEDEMKIYIKMKGRVNVERNLYVKFRNLKAVKCGVRAEECQQG